MGGFVRQDKTKQADLKKKEKKKTSSMNSQVLVEFMKAIASILTFLSLGFVPILKDI